MVIKNNIYLNREYLLEKHNYAMIKIQKNKVTITVPN